MNTVLGGGQVNINQDAQPSLYYPYSATQLMASNRSVSSWRKRGDH